MKHFLSSEVTDLLMELTNKQVRHWGSDIYYDLMSMTELLNDEEAGNMVVYAVGIRECGTDHPSFILQRTAGDYLSGVVFKARRRCGEWEQEVEEVKPEELKKFVSSHWRYEKGDGGDKRLVCHPAGF